MAKEYIEREVALSAIKQAFEKGERPSLYIKSIPAADVAPVRHGRWIEEDGTQICSECGEEHEWEDYRAPYCDTCGAKMNKEETNERI